jgi:hypothetical protein
MQSCRIGYRRGLGVTVAVSDSHLGLILNRSEQQLNWQPAYNINVLQLGREGA